ncbi:MAG TPA: formylglycine-generating enzyme family protein, partial [Candidatus Sumerlaeota bacterium]|nr:formylglycine-generating enzyme family protein [Candidatus Sumerlaeota bacterium]
MKRIAGCLGIACLWIVLLSSCSKPENQTGEEVADTGGEYFTNSIGMKFNLIPAGSFLMGLPDYEKDRKANEGPQHRVKLSQPFYLGICEVTQEQYKKVMGFNPSKSKSKNKPVVSVSWEDAQAFCEKLSKVENREYRLPTEAEWEYACRAGTQTEFYWGDVFDAKFAWCKENSSDDIQDVGTLKPNAWGLYDMSGNVAEWCSDRYGYRYPSSDEEVDPQ